MASLHLDEFWFMGAAKWATILPYTTDYANKNGRKNRNGRVPKIIRLQQKSEWRGMLRR
jgi:hypothetical protein